MEANAIIVLLIGAILTCFTSDRLSGNLRPEDVIIVVLFLCLCFSIITSFVFIGVIHISFLF